MSDELTHAAAPAVTDVTLAASDRLTVEAGLMSCRVGDDIVLLDSAGGRYFGLNEIAGATFDLLQSGNSLGQIHAALLQRYEIDSETLWTDIVNFANRLLTLRLAHGG